jgi:hypothetical protein
MQWARVVVVAGPAVVLPGLGSPTPRTSLPARPGGRRCSAAAPAVPVAGRLAVAAAPWGAESCRLGGANRRLRLRRLLYRAGRARRNCRRRARPAQRRAPGAVEVDRLFAVGNDLGEIGVWCFGIACAAAAVAVGGRVGRRALPGAVVVVAAAAVFVAGARISTGLGALGPCLPWPWGLGCWPRYCPIRSPRQPDDW